MDFEHEEKFFYIVLLRRVGEVGLSKRASANVKCTIQLNSFLREFEFVKTKNIHAILSKKKI